MKGGKIRFGVLVLAAFLVLTAIVPFGARNTSAQNSDFWIYGSIGYENRAAPETVNTIVTNNRTEETLSEFSTNGGYRQNLADLPSGYKEHDTIIVEAWQYKGNGEIYYDRGEFVVLPNEKEKEMNIIITLIPKPTVTAPAPMSTIPANPPEELLPLSPFTGKSEGGGEPGPLSRGDLIINTCTNPPLTFEDGSMELAGNLIITPTGCLRLKNFVFNLKTTSNGQYGVYIEREGGQYGRLEVWYNANGGSTIRPLGDPPFDYSYHFEVYGHLHVSGSNVTRMFGTIGGGGVRFHDGSIGLIEENSNISEGDTFGIYAEDAQDITIKNSVIVENGAMTPESDGTGIYLENSNAYLENNNIAEHELDGIQVWYSGSPVTIKGNNIAGNQRYGVWLHTSSNVQLVENMITSSSDGVFQLYGSNMNIESNNISQCGYGMYFYGNAGAYVYNNTLHDNDYGIDIRYTPWVTVDSNLAYNNAVGIGVRSRYTSVVLDKPVITNNRAVENEIGIRIYPWPSDVGGNTVGATPWIVGNIVERNDIGIESEDSGPTIEYNYVQYNDNGIFVNGFLYDTYFGITRQPTISNYNYIQMNVNWGLNISSSLPTANLNLIYGNGDGIVIWNAAPTIENNDICYNHNRGIYIFYLFNNETTIAYPEVRDNMITKNREIGIYVDNSGPIIEGSSPYSQKIVNSRYDIYLILASPHTLIKNNFIGSEVIRGMARSEVIQGMEPPPIPVQPEIGIYHAWYSFPRIDNNKIDLLKFIGISIVNGSAPIITNNTIKTKNAGSVGIFVGDYCTPQIGKIYDRMKAGNNITGPFASIHTVLATAKIEGNDLDGRYYFVMNGQFGILDYIAMPMDEVDYPLIRGNNITFNLIGIGEYGTVNDENYVVTPSRSIIKNNSIINNLDDGIYNYFSMPTIGGSGGGSEYENNIRDNGGWGIHSQYAKPTNSDPLGEGLWDDNNIGANGNGKILQEWRVKALVLHENEPVEGANVAVYECTNPPPGAPPPAGCTNWEQYPPGSYITYGDGQTDWITVREYFWDNADQQFDRGYHRFYAWKTTPPWSGWSEIINIRDNKPRALDPTPIPVNIS